MTLHDSEKRAVCLFSLLFNLASKQESMKSDAAGLLAFALEGVGWRDSALAVSQGCKTRQDSKV